MNSNSSSADAAGATDRAASPEGSAASTNSAMPQPDAQKPQLDFSASVRRETQGELVVEYRVTNRGTYPVLLVNRGDTSFGLGPGRVYVEPQADGVVNLAQRGYALPPGYSGPGPSAAIYPGVSELAPGKTASETLRLTVPKSRQHPYGRYYAEVPVPDPLRRVRFCLGFIPSADAPTKMTRGTRVLTSLQALAAQESLCSEPQELN